MDSSESSTRNRRFHALIEHHAHHRSPKSDWFRATRDGDIGRLKVMVNRMHAKDQEAICDFTMSGFGLLHVAAHFGRLEVCQYLIEKLLLDVNAGDIDGVTPLSYAALQGEEAVTRYLLEYDADPNKANHGGCTPLHNAAHNGNRDVVSLLLSAGANTNVSYTHGTPLHIAASYGNSGALKLLIDNHADPNLLSRTDGTSLVAAVRATKYGVSQSDSLDCIKLLVQGGADMNSAHRNTALVEATIFGLTQCIKYLLEAGADPNIPDALYGRMPIEIAAHLRNRSHVEMLFPFTSPIRAVAKWSVEGILAHEKSKLSTPKLIHGTPSARKTHRRTVGEFSEDNELNFYTPRQKKTRTSMTSRFSSPRQKSRSSTTTQRGSYSVQSVGEKRRYGTIQSKKCKRMLEYNVSSDSCSSPSSSSSNIGTLTLEDYASKFKLKLKKSVPVPHQAATRLMTRQGPKLVLRRSYMAMTKRHQRKKTLEGQFNSANFVVDLLDRSVTLEGVIEMEYNDSGGRKDRRQFVLMVKSEVFAGEEVPDDVAFWLKLIADQEDPRESRLLGNHIYMLESRLAFGLFMAFSNTIHSLRTDKWEKYEDLRLHEIFDKYYRWRNSFDFEPLNDTLKYKDEKDEDPLNESGEHGYGDDIMGLLWLIRCCWAHRAQKYPHLLVAVLLGEGSNFEGLLSDVQKALFEYGILQDM